jgi:transcription initiation factor TFIID subunit 5
VLLSFQLWISESADWLKPELAQLLYPVFTHLYLELVAGGHKVAAARFHKRHQSTFLGNAELAAFIRQLAPVTTPEDVDCAVGVVSDFRAAKYAVTVSDATWAHLAKYLQSCAQPTLIHVLRSKVRQCTIKHEFRV